MQLTFTADIAPDVMRNAMIFMGQALDAERPLSDLERLGWLVVCKYIVDRAPKGKGDQTMSDLKHCCENCTHWEPYDIAPRIGMCQFPIELPAIWPAAYLNRDGTTPTIEKFAMSNLNGMACQTFEAKA